MDIKLGLGNATGMFYHATAGTALPTDPTTSLAAAWKHIGDVSDAGITLAFNKSVTNLKNWANKIKRAIVTDHSETIQAPVMDTTEEVLKAVLGAANVSKSSNVITAKLSDTDLPPQEAFLFVMKDGNDMIMVGCSYGQITAVDNVSFAPGGAINWTPTITGMGTDGWKLIMKEGASGATGASGTQ